MSRFINLHVCIFAAKHWRQINCYSAIARIVTARSNSVFIDSSNQSADIVINDFTHCTSYLLHKLYIRRSRTILEKTRNVQWAQSCCRVADYGRFGHQMRGQTWFKLTWAVASSHACYTQLMSNSRQIRVVETAKCTFTNRSIDLLLVHTQYASTHLP